MRRRLIIALIVILAIAIAGAAAFFIYFKTVDGNLALSRSDASEALADHPEEGPYYVLCTADLSESASLAPSSEDRAIMLARVDDDARTLSLLGIPASMQIDFSGGTTEKIYGHAGGDDDAALISAVSEFVDVPISHFVTTDAQKISSMVDALGGVEMEFSSEIDDPSAGWIVIDAGVRQLTASQALVALRATNVSGGFSTCAETRAAFTEAVLAKALGKDSSSLPELVSDASSYISTDMDASAILSAADALRPFSDVAVFSWSVPCFQSTSTSTGEKLLTCNFSEWTTVREAFVQGVDPSAGVGFEGADELRSSTVEVRNGASVEGAATSLADSLESLGYEVSSVGNTDEGIIYPETLIVYTDPEKEDNAKKVQSDISQGRVIDGGDYYSTDADVLVIIGADWN